jgi:hypothetical protein
MKAIVTALAACVLLLLVFVAWRHHQLAPKAVASQSLAKVIAERRARGLPIFHCSCRTPELWFLPRRQSANENWTCEPADSPLPCNGGMDEQLLGLNPAQLAAIEKQRNEQVRLDKVIARHSNELLALPHVIWVGPGPSLIKLGANRRGLSSTGFTIAVEVDMPYNVSAVERELPKTLEGFPVVVNQPVAAEWLGAR